MPGAWLARVLSVHASLLVKSPQRRFTTLTRWFLVMEEAVFPVMKPSLPSPTAFSARLNQIDESGQFSNFGPQITELESRFAQRFQVSSDQVVVLANATLALTGLAQILAPDYWRVPSWTFIATALSAWQSGSTIRFADVDRVTQRLDFSETSLPSIVTLPFGVGVPDAWTDPSLFPPIVDAAASLGSVHDLSALPTSSNFVFSLHATKYLGAGEGGLVVTGDSAVAAELKAWSNFGFKSDRVSHLRGTNAKMSEFQAAVAHAALDSEKTQHEEWQGLRELSRNVDRALGIEIPAISNHSIAPYWIVQFDRQESRDSAERLLSENSVETRRWWSDGSHRMSAMSSVPHEGPLQTTESLAATTLGLPYFRGMTPANFDMIGDVLSNALGLPA